MVLRVKARGDSEGEWSERAEPDTPRRPCLDADTGTHERPSPGTMFAIVATSTPARPHLPHPAKQGPFDCSV